MKRRELLDYILSRLGYERPRNGVPHIHLRYEWLDKHYRPLISITDDTVLCFKDTLVVGYFPNIDYTGTQTEAEKLMTDAIAKNVRYLSITVLDARREDEQRVKDARELGV